MNKNLFGILFVNLVVNAFVSLLGIGIIIDYLQYEKIGIKYVCIMSIIFFIIILSLQIFQILHLINNMEKSHDDK